jgi:hypothetical protein
VETLLREIDKLTADSGITQSRPSF